MDRRRRGDGAGRVAGVGANRHSTRDARPPCHPRLDLYRRGTSLRPRDGLGRRQIDRADGGRVDGVDVPRTRRNSARIPGLAGREMMPWILDVRDAAGSADAGGKARALARAERAGLPVPSSFVLSASAFDDSLTAEQRASFEQTNDGRALARTVDAVAVAEPIRQALETAVRTLCPNGELVAVRSSASDEDGTQHSFAGQLESYLNVAPTDVADRVRLVWRSGFTERILAYRRGHGLPALPRPPAVLIQRMAAPRAAGVAFSADPVSGRRGVTVVSAVHGLGSALVSGETDADTWLVDRGRNIIERRIVAKRRMHVSDPGSVDGVRVIDVPSDLVEPPALSDAEVVAVADLARSAARHFGRPQDIEWAIADPLLLLQSRPITSLRAMPDPDGRLAIWDN